MTMTGLYHFIKSVVRECRKPIYALKQDRHYIPLYRKTFFLNSFKSRFYLTLLIPLDLHISSGSFKGSMNRKLCWFFVRTRRNIISENVRIYSSLTSCNNWKNIPLWNQMEVSKWLHQCQALFQWCCEGHLCPRKKHSKYNCIQGHQERVQLKKIISQEIGLLEVKFVYWQTTSHYVQHSWKKQMALSKNYINIT